MAQLEATLLELPYELKIQIFNQVPSKEIIRLRTTSRALRDFVDDNSEQISKAICTRELARLKDFIAYYVTYEGDVSFLEALSRWGRLRGWAPSNIGLSRVANTTSIDAFAKHWVPIKRYPDLSEQSQRSVAGIAQLLWKVSQDLPGFTGDDRMYRYQVLRKIQHLRQNIPGFTDEECISMYNELKHTAPGERLPGPPRKIQRIVSDEMAFVDPTYAPNPEPSKLWRTVNPIAHERCITAKVAVEVFGVPRLPWTNQFTYCIESDWARYTIDEIIRLHTVNRPIPPLMFAAGMEELRIW